jgi:hypothetical protein
MVTFKKNTKALSVSITIIICILVFFVKIEASSNTSDSKLSWNDECILSEPIENCAIFQIEILREYESSKMNLLRRVMLLY